MIDVRGAMTPACRLIALVWVLLLLGACSSPGSTSLPPSATPGSPLTEAQLKYALIDRLGPRWFCDPDEYPVARGDEAQLAVQRFGEVRSDADAYAEITRHLGLPTGDPTADQKVAIYRAWKQLKSFTLESIGSGRYRFDYLARPAAGVDGTRTTGVIDQGGAMTIEGQAPAGQPPCPICLARGTRIATPTGDIAVEDVRPGMLVWSLDVAGRRIATPVDQIGSTSVPSTHRVVRLALEDGRVVEASPGHPLPDGRLVADLAVGDLVDGAAVVSVDLVAYKGGATFDLLPSGPTGTYFANGIPLGSTLAVR